MQSYQLDLLDEKALVILRGLEQLSIISLKPLTKDAKQAVDYEIVDSAVSNIEEPTPNDKLNNFKKLRGSIDLGLTREEVDLEIDKMREGWL